MIHKLKLLFATTAVAAIAGPAFAQTPTAPREAVVEELIVTAQKREERLQDVPLTVTVVGGEQLERQNITNVTELQNASPELNFTAGPSSGYSIRGSGTSTFTRSAENNVSIVVDGVIQGQLFPPVNSLFDVARVEVLSGPQGMLFGKNASGGVVNIVTNAPNPADTEFRLSARVGTEGYQVFQGVANLPVSDTAALRLNAFSNSQDGFINNRFNDTEIGGFTNWGARARFLWEVTDRLTLNVIADFEKQHGGNAVWTVRSAQGAALPAGLAACGVVPGPENFDVCLDGPTSRVQETYGLSIQADYDLGGGHTLTSITADRQYSRAVNTDSDALPRNILNQNKATDFNNQFSQELRIASPGDQRLEYVAGVFYYNYNYKPFVDQAGTLGILPFTVDRASIENINQFSYAVFGQATYALTDQFNLILGGRFTRDVLKAKTFNFVIPESGRRLTPGFTPPGGTFRDETSEDDFSYRVGVQYLPNPDVTFFATYTEGYKGPALNAVAGGLAGPRIVEPETPKNFEAGVKAALFGRRLVLDVTAFDTTTENFQAQTVQTIEGVQRFVFSNASELKARGVQVNAYARASENLSFTAGALYNDAEYGDFLVTCNLPFTAGCTTTTAGLVINAKGRQLAGAPKWKLVGSVSYDFRVADGLDGFVQANATYRSKINTSATPDPNLQLDSSARMDARVGVRTEDERWTLALFAKNLTDERQPAIIFRDPLNSVNNYDQAFGPDAVRVIGVSLDVRY